MHDNAARKMHVEHFHMNVTLKWMKILCKSFAKNLCNFITFVKILEDEVLSGRKFIKL